MRVPQKEPGTHKPDPPESDPVAGASQQFAKGDADELIGAIGAELRKIASQHMRKERGYHTLQTTALVNEAYLRLAASRNPAWNDRNHFLAVASMVMRRILIDYARARRASVGRQGEKVAIEAARLAIGPVHPDVLDIDAVLTELARIAPRQAQLVELRFFGGLTLEETAEVLDISARAADKDWALARAWLRRKLGRK